MNSWGRGSQACFIDDYSHCPNSSHQQVNGGCKTSIPLIRSSSVVSRNLPIAQMVVVKSLSRVRLFCDPMNCAHLHRCEQFVPEDHEQMLLWLGRLRANLHGMGGMKTLATEYLTEVGVLDYLHGTPFLL